MAILSRIFSVVSILAAAGCIAIGLLIIKPEKEKLEKNLSEQTQLKETALKNAADEKKAKEAVQNELKTTQTELTSTKSDLESKKKDIATRDGEIAQLKTSLTTATSQIAAQKADLEKFKSSLPEGVPIEQVASKFKELKDGLAAMESEKAELGKALQKLEAENKKQKDFIDRDIYHKRNGTMPKDLTGKILQVNKDWNFVVLDIGIDQGVQQNVPMAVHRSGNLIGKIKITSVEKSIAIGDILPEWGKEEFQAGDYVSYIEDTVAQ